MGIKKISTLFLVTLSIALLALLASRVRVAATADSVAVLKTTGMTCGSCAGKISDALKRMPGVAVTEVDVANGWVLVGYDTKVAQPEKLAEKVKETGYFSMVYDVVTPERFKQITGHDIGRQGVPSGGCGGCGTNKQG